MDVTVIICCYNSATRIIPTLEHLAKQKLEGLVCELILVDNNCTDNTVDVSNKVWAKNGSPFSTSIVQENKPGLANARRAGVLSAKGEVIVFCDDDNWLDENYLRISYDTITQNSEIGVLGGQSIAVADTEIPNWFYTNYGAYACGVLSLESGDVTNRLWVWGAGMVIKREILLELYKKYSHKTLGRTKDSYMSGEDVEICFWHIYEGYKLWYEEKLILWHYMPDKRLLKSEAVKQFNGQDASSRLLKEEKELAKNTINFANGSINRLHILIQLLKLNFYKGHLLYRAYIINKRANIKLKFK